MRLRACLQVASTVLALGDSALALPTKVVDDGNMTPTIPTTSTAKVASIDTGIVAHGRTPPPFGFIGVTVPTVTEIVTSCSPFTGVTVDGHENAANTDADKDTSTFLGFIGVTTPTATFVKAVRPTTVGIEARNAPIVAVVPNPSPSTTCTVASDCWSPPNYSGQIIDNKATPFVPGVAAHTTIPWGFWNETVYASAIATGTGLAGPGTTTLGTALAPTAADGSTTTKVESNHTPAITSSGDSVETVIEYETVYSSAAATSEVDVVIVTVTAGPSPTSTSDMWPNHTITITETADPSTSSNSDMWPESPITIEPHNEAVLKPRADWEFPQFNFTSGHHGPTEVVFVTETTFAPNLSTGTTGVDVMTETEVVYVTATPDAETLPVEFLDWSEFTLPIDHFTRSATV